MAAKHKLSSILASVFFSAIPAIVVGILVSAIHPIIALICALGVFGFGLDCCLNGSDR